MAFKKLLAAAGLGNMRVDARLDSAEVAVGEHVTGELVVDGGLVAQDVRSLTVVLCADGRKTDDGTAVPVTLATATFDEAFTQRARQRRRVRFSLPVPVGTPPAMTERPAPVYVASGADVELAVDPDDHDPVTVRPAPVHGQTVAVLRELGYSLDGEAVLRTRDGLLQELTFTPISGNGVGVEVAFVPAADGGLDLIVDQQLAATAARRFPIDVLDHASEASQARVALGGGAAGPGEAAVAEALRARIPAAA